MTPATRLRQAVLSLGITVTAVVCGGSLWPHGAGGQASLANDTTEIDMTPAEESPEIRALLTGSSFTPDRGEPAGAVKAYLTTDEKLRRAARRIQVGLVPGEADFDPNRLLDEVLAVRQSTATRYPMSRHAWQGLGDAWWLKYLWQHRATQLRDAVNAYIKALDLLVPQGPGPSGPAAPASLAMNIANGLATLGDRATLDAFFNKLRNTDFWDLVRDPYVVALGTLNDPRADAAFRDLLQLMPPDETLPDYVDYLWDHGRYQEALNVLDRKPRSKLYEGQRGQRGAILERLGRFAEAQAEYRWYLDEVRKIAPWRLFSLPERYRIPGSAYQHGVSFRPGANSLPKPESRLWRWLQPTFAWAGHVPTGCGSEDWYCLAELYLPLAIHGEAGCINTSTTCWGTVGGQRAVAWNIRTRVFYNVGERYCPNRERCFNYAPGINFTWGDSWSLARRYYYVLDEWQQYKGLGMTMNESQRLEAANIARTVNVDGSVPDPNAGACLGSYVIGDVCGGGCDGAIGSWDSFFASQSSCEFRGGQAVWKTAQNSSCQWEELVPRDADFPNTAQRCGKLCYLASWWGATCPKYGWLRTRYCSSTQPTWGPLHGNFYWRFNAGIGTQDPLPSFNDVPPSHPLRPWITAVAAAGIDSGCTADHTYFCPDATITRATMAGWLLRAMHAGSYQPPAATGMFADVPVWDPTAPWSEQLAREGITSGCGNNPPIYCPNAQVSRGQMAVFLLRAKYGASYQPPPATGLFTDVPIDHPFARFIEQLTREGITTGCSQTPAQYCPNATVPRGQMAVFVARGFNLPM